MKTVANPNPNPNPKSSPDAADAHKLMMQSGTAASEVLTSAARNIQLIQSNAGAEMFTRSLESIAPAFSPAGAPYFLQQLPLFYRLHAAAMVKAATDSFSELLRAQQALMEMGSQASWHSAQESADTTTKTLRKFYSRRVASQVIQFPDRRAA